MLSSCRKIKQNLACPTRRSRMVPSYKIALLLPEVYPPDLIEIARIPEGLI
jgi:hypothetical protein